MRLVAATLLAGAAALSAAPSKQVEEGRLLIYRSGCGHCHGLGSSAGAPDLAGLRERFSHFQLPDLIAAPRRVKESSRMPHLFGDDPEKHREEIEALAQYLLSVAPAKEKVPPPAGDARRGRELYHRIGCAACHQPDGDALLPDSAPIVMGNLYYREALIEYLLQPKTVLMPSLKLTRQEASDLAAWLQRDHQPELEDPPAISPELAKRGYALFRSRRCISCHEPPGNSIPEPGPGPVEITRWNAGCLSDSPTLGVPHFAFTRSQRQAIEAAGRKRSPKSPREIIDHTLTSLRCHACHERSGRGGPSDDRRPLFKVAEQMAESYGDFGNIPPKLDQVGRKLTREWLRRILVEGHGEVRPYLATRMPHYRISEDEVEKLINALETADRRNPPIEIDVSGLPGHQRGHYGRNLMGTHGLSCITCHGLKGQRPLGAPTIDLTNTVRRLRPAWFKEILLDPQSVQPGTLMPPLFLNRPKADQEVEQIWTYLKELDQRRLPDGLLRSGDFELKPSEEGKPIVFRTFLEGVGTHAIAVGNPQGTHFAFDSRTSQWAQAWKGKFLDAMSTWDDRYATPARPLGGEVYRFPLDNLDRRFQGFRLDPKGVPIFLYTENGVPVEDSIAFDARGELHRTIRRGASTVRQVVHLHNHQASFHNEE